MSAGGVLEIPAFAVGLAGIADLVEKIIRLWQLIAAARHYGEDLVRAMCTLYFEYSVFYNWCQGMRVSPDRRGASSLLRPVPPRPAPGLSPFAETLYLQSRSPFHIPVSRIVEILESIERITTKLRSRADEHSAAHGTVGPATHGVLEIALGSSATPIASRAHRGLREWAYNRISMIRRVQMQVPMAPTPSELEKLNTLIREFKDLNRDLWNFLSTRRRDAFIERELPAMVFDIPYDRRGLGVLQEASSENFPAISNTANLWIGRVEIESTPLQDSIRVPISESELKLYETRQGPWQLATMKEDTLGANRVVVVEWYECQGLSEADIAVSTDRINNLSQITRLSSAKSDLRILNSPGYFRKTDDEGVKLGLVFNFPDSADPRYAPVSLASLFTKDRSGRSRYELSLRQKFILANQLAASLAAFHRVRWYHKNFNAHSIVFFHSLADYNVLLLSHPYISGFGFSRPDDPAGRSLNPTWAMHIHPDLEHDNDPARPKFQRHHDIYSLGVLLFDIGTWGTAKQHLVKSGRNVTPEEFRCSLERYSVDLKGRMGNEYRRVTEWCLRQPEEDAADVITTSQISLETFYLRVMHVLAQCHCSMIKEG